MRNYNSLLNLINRIKPQFMKSRKIFLLFFFNVGLVLILYILCELGISFFIPNIKLPGTSSKLLKDSVYFETAGLNPNSNGLSSGMEKSVDTNGFWKYSGSSSKDTLDKILLIGDSVTMGIGIENDSTFGGILSDKLKSYKFLNPSLIAYTSKDYFNVINCLVDSTHNSYDINKIVIAWCLNDVYPRRPIESAPGVVSEDLLNSIIKIVRNNSRTFQLLKNIFSDRPKSYFDYDKQFYDLGNPDYKKALDYILQIKRIADNYSISLTIIPLPYEFQIRKYGDRNVWKPQSLLKSTLTRNDIKFIDIRKAFKDNVSSSNEFYLYGDGIHFSNKGHRVIANEIIKHLR